MHNASRSYVKSSRQHIQHQQNLPPPDDRMIPNPDQYGSSHGQLLPNTPTPGGSSYVNFNLSTIFPEINVPGPNSDKLAALLPTTPVPPTLPSSRNELTLYQHKFYVRCWRNLDNVYFFVCKQKQNKKS